MVDAPRLFCVDTVLVDVVLKIAALPELGGDAVATDRTITTGGGFNMMSSARRHGMDVVYAGQLGHGAFADLARADLAAENIVAPIAAGADDVGCCVVLVDASGERSFVTSPGAEQQLRLIDLEQLVINAGDYVFLSGYNLVYPAFGATVSAWLGGLPEGVIVALDPGPRVLDIASDLLESTLERVQWLLCSATEARQLSGEQEIDAALTVLLGRCPGVVVHDGARGCVLATRALSPIRVEGYRVEVVDTNGAGDTHDGVFLAELARGTRVVEAAQRANGASALAVGRLGPATCPTRDEVSNRFGTFN